MRRQTYKGAVSSAGVLDLPVDCASIPGQLVCLACYLMNRGLTPTQNELAWQTVSHLDACCNVTGDVVLLPGVDDAVVRATRNRVLVTEWERVLTALDLQAIITDTSKQPVCTHCFLQSLMRSKMCLIQGPSPTIDWI